MAKLHRISDEIAAPRGAVVFVHGLNGRGAKDHHFSTWKRDGDEQKFWPRWLAVDYPAVAVYCLEYNSHASHWTGDSMQLIDRASDAVADLLAARIDRLPLLFICHSLGGLLVKQMLRDSHDLQGSEEGNVFENTRGVAFYATPHAGTDLAQTVQKFRWLLAPTQAVRDLLPNSPILASLNTWYINRAFRAGVASLVFFETKKFPAYNGVIVDRASAALGGVGSLPIPAEDSHHSEACCPRDRQHNIYARLTRFLDDTLLRPATPSAAVAPMPPPAIDEAAMRAQILEALRGEADAADHQGAASLDAALAEAKSGDYGKAAAIFAAIESKSLAAAAPLRRRASEAARLEAMTLYANNKAKALARLEDALRHDPDNDAALRDLVEIAPLAGSLAKAKRALERVIAIDRTSGEVRDLSVSYYKLGGILEAEGNLPAARKAYEDSFAIHKRLAEADPSSAQAQRDLSVSYNMLGGILKAEGNLPAARTAYEDSLAIRKRLAEADPSSAQAQRDLSVSFDKLGGILEAEGNLPAARTAYEDSLAIDIRLAEADPTSAQAQRDLSVSFDKLGGILQAEGNLPAARTAYEDSLAIYQRLAEADPSSAQAQRDLSVSHEKLGGILEAEGNLPAARTAYEDSLAIAKRLAEADPSSAQAQRDLSVSHEKLGGILEAEGNLPAARTAYEDSLAIRKRLAEADPSSAQAQRDLVVSHMRLVLLGDASPCDHLNAAQRIVLELERMGALWAEHRNWRAEIAQRLRDAGC